MKLDLRCSTPADSLSTFKFQWLVYPTKRPTYCRISDKKTQYSIEIRSYSKECPRITSSATRRNLSKIGNKPLEIYMKKGHYKKEIVKTKQLNSTKQLRCSTKTNMKVRKSCPALILPTFVSIASQLAQIWQVHKELYCSWKEKQIWLLKVKPKRIKRA